MKKYTLTTASAILGLAAIFVTPAAFSQAQYAFDLGVYPQCSGCHATTDDSSGNGGNSRNRLRGAAWYQCTPPQVLNNAKHLCEVPSVIPTCFNGQILNPAQTACVTPPPPTCTGGQVLNPAQTACVTPPPVIPTCSNGQILNSAQTACVTPPPVIPACASGQVLNPAKTACVISTPIVPTCATGEFLNLTKTACVKPPVTAVNTKPVLNAVALQWDAQVGVLTTIPLSVKDAEQDVFSMSGSVQGSKFSAVHPDAAGLPSIDFSWTPTAAQANKIYSISFMAKETKTALKLTSNKVAVKIRVWAAGDRSAASITKLNVMTSVWSAGKLTLAGNVKFNSLLTAAEKQTFITQKLDLTVTSGTNPIGGALVGSATVKLDKNGNWSIVLPVAQAQIPCDVTLQYDGQNASRTVSGSPATCLKTAAATGSIPLQFAENDNESGDHENGHSEHDD